LIKEFLIYATLIVTILVATNLHYLFFKNSINQDTFNIAKLTTIVEPSLSASLFENRFLLLDKSVANPIYPDMMNIKFSELR